MKGTIYIILWALTTSLCRAHEKPVDTAPCERAVHCADHALLQTYLVQLESTLEPDEYEKVLQAIALLAAQEYERRATSVLMHGGDIAYVVGGSGLFFAGLVGFCKGLFKLIDVTSSDQAWLCKISVVLGPCAAVLGSLLASRGIDGAYRKRMLRKAREVQDMVSIKLCGLRSQCALKALADSSGPSSHS